MNDTVSTPNMPTSNVISFLEHKNKNRPKITIDGEDYVIPTNSIEYLAICKKVLKRSVYLDIVCSIIDDNYGRKMLDKYDGMSSLMFQEIIYNYYNFEN